MMLLTRTTIFGFLLLFLSGAASAQDLEITNIRVGQGDATLIQGPPAADGSRVNILFDGGDVAAYNGGKVIGAVLSKHGVKSLDYLIVSHYDVDHIGGIVSGPHHGDSFLLGWNKTPGAIGDDDNDGNDGWVGAASFAPDKDEIGRGDDIPVRCFVDRGDTPAATSQAYRKYRLLAESMGERVSLSNQASVDGFEIDLGSGSKMTALAGNGYVRNRGSRVARVNTENERSLSFLVSYKDFHFLISGDMIGRTYGSEDAKVESAVGDVIQNMGIIVDVLHVDHHGGNNGSDSVFLEKIKPVIAIISAGNDNDYHHPHDETLQRLEQAKVYRIIQTAWGATESVGDEVRRVQAIYQGDVVVTSDGDNYTVSTSRTFKADDNPGR